MNRNKNGENLLSRSPIRFPKKTIVEKNKGKVPLKEFL